MRFALDAMGGDLAPEVPVKGALLAHKELGVEIVLIGDKEKIIPILPKGILETGGIDIIHAPDVVRGEDPPKKALEKKGSSISVAFQAYKEGYVDGIVSAGNTGAVIMSAVVEMGRLKGISRPALAGIFSMEEPLVLIDVGATTDARARHLYEFGLMAEGFLKTSLGIKEPRIGLLNIGEEKGKGNKVTKEADAYFSKSRFHYVGHVEGWDLFKKKVHAAVCDGFVGNILLKALEGLGEMLGEILEEAMDRQNGEVRPFMDKKRLWSYEEYGGAPLLGVPGIVILCHGRSSPKAIFNAIKMAKIYKEKDLVKGLLKSLESD